MSTIGKVLIGGGSGFVGRRLIRHLPSAGYEPVMISRTPGKGRMTWNDLYRVGLPDNCKAVVNLAGENIGNVFKRFNDDFKCAVYDSRVETTKTLVDAIVKSDHPPEVFIGASAIGYYKPDDSALYDEESPGGNFDFMSRLCHDWERSAERVSQKPNVRHVTVRIGLVLGREGGLIHSIYMPFFFGFGGRIASGRQWMSWIHVEDLVGIILHSIRNDKITGVLNAVAPDCVRNDEFTRQFAKAMKRPGLLPLPEFALNAIFGKERGEIMTKGVHVLPRRTLETGYKYEYDNIRAACEEVSRITPDPALYHTD